MTKTKTILAYIIWFMIWATAVTWFAFKDGIDLYFTKTALIEEMDWFNSDNIEARIERKWAQLKLDMIDKRIDWNKQGWAIAKWKLDLIEGFIKEQ